MHVQSLKVKSADSGKIMRIAKKWHRDLIDSRQRLRPATICKRNGWIGFITQELFQFFTVIDIWLQQQTLRTNRITLHTHDEYFKSTLSIQFDSIQCYSIGNKQAPAKDTSFRCFPYLTHPVLNLHCTVFL